VLAGLLLSAAIVGSISTTGISPLTHFELDVSG
jgi:hypothetical protein